MKIKLIEDGKMPEYKTEWAAGADCYARKGTTVKPGETKVIPLGIALEIPHGFEVQVRGRSGLASRGILAHVGTIDEDYTGEIGAIIFNSTSKDFVVNKYDRIAQIVLNHVHRMKFEPAEELTATERGTNGFGSTGI